MKSGIAYQGDTNDLRRAASSTAQSRDDIIKCEYGVFNVQQPTLGVVRTKEFFGGTSSGEPFSFTRKVERSGAKMTFDNPSPMRIADVRHQIRINMCIILPFNDVGTVKIKLFS